MTGLAPRTEDGQPAPTPVAYLDYLAGCYAAIGILAALLVRDRTGQGAHLEIAQREVAAQVLAARAGHVAPSRPIRVEAAMLMGSAVLGDRERCSHLARLPFRFNGSNAPAEQPLGTGPTFGGSSRAVLMQWAGLTADEVDRLIRAGIVVAATEELKAVGSEAKAMGSEPKAVGAVA
jgi:crotonobetainyl-CoA:carnitine CoA-transferase CaiB-like acyl-CoA transferase